MVKIINIIIITQFQFSFKLSVKLKGRKMDEAKENIKTAAKDAIESVKSFAESAANNVRSVTNDAVESIRPVADESAKAVKDAATSATNKIKDFVDPPPEDSETDFLAVGVGLLVAGLLTWGIYKAYRHFNPASLQDDIKRNKEKMANSKSSLLDKIKENKERMHQGRK